MKLDPSGRTTVSVRDVSDYDRCPWAVAKRYHSVRFGSWPARPLEQPLRELMGTALVNHRQRVERMWTTHADHAVRLDDDVAPDQLMVMADGNLTIVNPRTTSHDPSSGLLVEVSADALIPEGAGSYRIEQARLGRSGSRKRLIEMAGTREVLQAVGLPISPRARIVTADCHSTEVSLKEATENWQSASRALAGVMAGIDAEDIDLDWSTTPLDQCGREACEWCQQGLADHDDLFHIARIRRDHRKALRERGIVSMEQFATASIDELSDTVSVIDPGLLRRTHLQASLQVLRRHSLDHQPPTQVVDAGRLASIAPPGPGDIYLDFEGDPAYREWPEGALCDPMLSGPQTWLGIDYLVGVVESDSDQYRSWWADDFSGEAKMWASWVEWLGTRLARHPNLRVYHYAQYEHTALERLATRHQLGQELVQRLQREGLLVDLYRTVMASVAVGTQSYSLKALEPLYFDGSERAGITGGGESVLAFEDYRIARGEQAGDIRAAITRYNAVDCRSTKALHRWLLAQPLTANY